MNDMLKQRLVGALILVALGVVFWPIIFVEPGQRSTMEQVRIPPPPMIDTAPIESPDQEGLRASPAESGGEEAGEAFIEDIIESPATTATVAEPAAPDPAMTAESHPRGTARAPGARQPGVPVAWLLQVASVSSAAKADELRTSCWSRGKRPSSRNLPRAGKSFTGCMSAPISSGRSWKNPGGYRYPLQRCTRSSSGIRPDAGNLAPDGGGLGDHRRARRLDPAQPVAGFVREAMSLAGWVAAFLWPTCSSTRWPACWPAPLKILPAAMLPPTPFCLSARWSHRRLSPSSPRNSSRRPGLRYLTACWARYSVLPGDHPYSRVCVRHAPAGATDRVVVA